MPIYEYRAREEDCPYCRNSFVISRSMREEPLKYCPRCGCSLEKVFSCFSIGRNILSRSYLKEHGFTRLVRDDSGGYREDK